MIDSKLLVLNYSNRKFLLYFVLLSHSFSLLIFCDVPGTDMHTNINAIYLLLKVGNFVKIHMTSLL